MSELDSSDILCLKRNGLNPDNYEIKFRAIYCKVCQGRYEVHKNDCKEGEIDIHEIIKSLGTMTNLSHVDSDFLEGKMIADKLIERLKSSAKIFHRSRTTCNRCESIKEILKAEVL